MGPSLCRDKAVITTREVPLRLKYRLHIHRGAIDVSRANEMAAAWATEPDLHAVRSSLPHRHFQIEAMG